jgi:SIR2-like domain
LGALLIQHTAVLIGYSLDDPDMRQVLQVARNHLGRLAAPAWAIQVESAQHVINRFERRGVRVISLPRRRGISYGEQLAELFDALREHWEAELRSQSTDERARADLKLPPRSSRICYFRRATGIAEPVSWARVGA